jgi:hypothetical protein
MSVCLSGPAHGDCGLAGPTAQMTDCLFIGLECWNSERWTDLIAVFTSESELRLNSFTTEKSSTLLGGGPGGGGGGGGWGGGGGVGTFFGLS